MLGGTATEAHKISNYPGFNEILEVDIDGFLTIEPWSQDYDDGPK